MKTAQDIIEYLDSWVKTYDDICGYLDENNDAYELLFGEYVSEMPYGTAKARTGDPHEWIVDRLSHEFGCYKPDQRIPFYQRKPIHWSTKKDWKLQLPIPYEVWVAVHSIKNNMDARSLLGIIEVGIGDTPLEYFIFWERETINYISCYMFNDKWCLAFNPSIGTPGILSLKEAQSVWVELVQTYQKSHSRYVQCYWLRP
tara:strand:+ start:5224 stop:5823 length:600 start_codon:yes stop_codon:yes gene_type:complete